MLTLYQYIGLNQNQRAEILWRNGEFISNIPDHHIGFTLYSLYGFLVEVTLINEKISDITPFRQGERLDKYLKEISIQELMDDLKPPEGKYRTH